MIDIDFSWFAALYVLFGMVLTFTLWFLYDLRSAREWKFKRRHTAYHCIKCGTIYSAHSGDAGTPCPNCQFVNNPLRF